MAEVFRPLRKSRKIAFTLAEVLITLGIIGVLSTIILPQFIENYQKKVTVEKLKVAYTTIGQAIDAAKNDNDDFLVIDDLVSPNKSIILREKYIDPYIKNSVDSNQGRFCPRTLHDGWKAVYSCTTNVAHSKKGFSYWLVVNGGARQDGTTYLNYVYCLVDINTIKNGPNQISKDIFVFSLALNKTDRTIYGITPNRHSTNLNKSREYLLRNGGSCSQGAGEMYYNGYDCMLVIVKDGWKILENYPW